MTSVRLSAPMVALLRQLWETPTARLRCTDEGWRLYSGDDRQLVSTSLVVEAQTMRWVMPAPQRNGYTIAPDGISRLHGARDSMRPAYAAHCAELDVIGRERYGRSWEAAQLQVLNVALRYGMDPDRTHNRLPEHALKAMLREMATIVCETLFRAVKAYEDDIHEKES